MAAVGSFSSTLLLLTLICVGYTSADVCSNELVKTSMLKGADAYWYPEPCTKCTCDPVKNMEQCEPVQCLAPLCGQGEVMTIDPSQCCPICSPVFKDCELNGATIKHGKSLRNDQCQLCECSDGEISCQDLSCTEMQCASRVEDECCRNCSSSMCEDNGQLHPHNSTWKVGNCILCECNSGVKTCFAQTCPKLNCKHPEFTPEGACCPICSNDKCWSNGRLYQHEQQWQEETCEDCLCISGSPRCMKLNCHIPNCPRNTASFQDQGDCCAMCRPNAGMCAVGNNTYYNGQIWRTSSCDYCSCIQGKVRCGKVQCLTTQCAQNEYLVHSEESCCPVCKLKEVCVHDQVLRATELWSPWVETPCQRCLCREGTVQCYDNACPAGNATSSLLSANILSYVSVTRQQSTIISTANIEIVANNVDDVRITVIQEPQHGTLNDGNKQFSYQELADGLRYQHDGSADSDDFVVLQASDSDGTQNALLPINVQASQALVMVNNNPLEVERGGQEMITPKNLQYEAGGGEKDHSIQYLITEQTSAGSVVIIVPQPQGSDLQVGWTSLADGTMMRQTNDFRQSDVNEGSIFYLQESADPDVSADSFTFEVLYKETGTKMVSQTFDIKILPATVFAAPSLSASSSLALVALEGGLLTLTPSHLSFIDEDTTPNKIIYDITKPLAAGQGFIVYNSSPTVPISRFSQQDINNGLVSYQAANIEVGPEEQPYSFTFKVTDDTGKVAPEQGFSILVLPVDNQPPLVESGVRLNVQKGRAVAMDDNLLRVEDMDTPKAELTFTVEVYPSHGDLVKLDGPLNTVLRPGDNYSYSEILSGDLYYSHDDSPGVDDSFTLVFYDTAQSTKVNIPVTIQYSDFDSPTLSFGASMKLRLNEGEKKVITLNELEYVESSVDGLVLYHIAGVPQFGQIMYQDRPMVLGDGFTQPDIVARIISYQADAELGNLEIMDTIYLNVSDTAGNMAAMQPFAVTIKATDNHPPVVTIHSDLEVEEGRRKQITKTYISVEDPDSILTNLMVVIDSLPTLGVLKIISADGQGQEVRQSQVQMFQVSDMYAGIVYYDQLDHEEKEPRSDFFWFHMTDGVNISPVTRFNITILARNDEPSTIISDTVFVEEGGTVAITNSSIYVSDIDTEFDGSVADVHTFTLINPPMEGELVWRNGSKLPDGQSFTMQNILSEDIRYKHNGDEEVSQDLFTIRVSDGYFEDTKYVPIDIALVDDETPRLKINDGLRLKVGGERVIDSSVLHATDIDSDDSMLIYTITQSVHRGLLFIESANGSEEAVTVFTPADLENGELKYRSDKNVNRAGFDFFKFDVIDINENKLMDQIFYIDLLTDTSLPSIRVNAPLSVKEDSFSPLSTSNLYITDLEASADSLMIYIDIKPQYGNLVLEDDQQKARPVGNFTMADIIARRVFYVHETEQEVTADSFTFTASDGFNNVTQTFSIRLIQVDDSLPVVTMNSMKVLEGQSKPLSEFDLKVTDNDTKDELLTVSLLAPPAHGSIVLSRDGQEVDAMCRTFTMDDIYEGRVSYKHDNSETTSDSFTFTVTDQTNDGFFLRKDGAMARTASPLTMEISVQLVDDGLPSVGVNQGLSHLEMGADGRAYGKITSNELKVIDPDTDAGSIRFKVTSIPRSGMLVKLPDTPISQFTQEDIDNQVIVYRLSEDITETEDLFKFDVMDSKPNVLKDLTFHVTWSRLKFTSANVSANEQQGLIEVTVARIGSLNSHATVGCELRRDGGSATADLLVVTPQIQFNKGERMSACKLSVVNDTLYEGVELFTLRLVSPVKALVEDEQVLITLTDTEDEPVIEFMKAELTFNESVGVANVPVMRSGDASTSMTVLCSTVSQTATGSSGRHLQSGTDYISWQDGKVQFGSGETTSNCSIKILDDTLYEVSEKFEVVLSSPSSPARLGTITTATITISGPNDASTIQMAATNIRVYEDEKAATVEIVRVGLDLSRSASVWCTTAMASEATPGVDYVPISQKILFSPGESKARCEVQIIDDTDEPIMEGVETFTVTLAAADSRSVIGEPAQTVVSIDDLELDQPILSFPTAKYTVDEDAGILSIPILREGDVSCSVSAICYTRQQSASVMVDYTERPLTNVSRVELLAGERNASCDLEIIDDSMFETTEFLLIRLDEPQGCQAIIGDLDVSVVTIQDPEDEPRLSIQSSSYSVREPTSADVHTAVRVYLSRYGDASGPAQVRLSTRDRSAVSGVDYQATSTLIDFFPAERSKWVEISILYNPDIEWHESFLVVLEDWSGVSSGENVSAVINILDTDSTGGLVLPAVPVVVSLHEYDSGNVKTVTEVSPAYPLLCVSPCDPHYPQYRNTQAICQNSKINSSAMVYGWEVSYPVQAGSKVSSYVKVTQATSFSRVNTTLLETFYFRSGFKVRCIATPLHPNGQSGVPIKSAGVDVHSKGVCSNPLTSNAHSSLSAQSFSAKLDYIDPGVDSERANTIHVSVEVPHQDGMLPIISTMPIYNVNYLLTQSAFAKQHVCSNLPNTSYISADSEDINGFLDDQAHNNVLSERLHHHQAVTLYRHLNRLTCRWKFEAWFDLTQIMDYCGGRVTHNFDVDSASKSFVTVHQPMYVSYVFAKAPSGWASLSHQTTLEFSFYYDNVKFDSGGQIMREPKASVEIIRVGIGEDGKMSLNLRTQAHFRGMLLVDHYTAPPGQKGELQPPKSVSTKFSLKHLWSQSTFDGPVQIWQANSRYSLQDYSGSYTLKLLACVANSAQSYSVSADQQKCAITKTLSFPLNVAFQQTNRPVPLVYSLATQFQLTNNKRLFLMEPQTSDFGDASGGFHGVFQKGERLFGKVFWDPSQDLESAFRLQIDKVFICTGWNGYTPTYDPTGKIYNEGQQYGCLEPNNRLKHRFLLLDRGEDDVTTKEFNGLPFKANFANSMSGMAELNSMPSTDGFALSIDPLFSTTSGQQWHVHILYRIGTPDSMLYSRRKRALSDKTYKEGTNLIMINLDHPDSTPDPESKTVANSNREIIVERTKYVTNTPVVVVLVVVVVVVIVSISAIAVYVRRAARSAANANTAPQEGAGLTDSIDKLPPTYDQVTSISLDHSVQGTAV